MKPPPTVRFLAAAAHAGFWAGALPLHVALQTYDFDLYTRPSGLLGLLLLFAFTPPAVTLLAARRSVWRPFLRVHGVAALTAHTSGAVAALTIACLDPQLWELPAALEVFLWTAAGVTLLCWFVLPFGAAYRAKDGDLPWYPIITRLMSRGAAGDGRGPA